MGFCAAGGILLTSTDAPTVVLLQSTPVDYGMLLWAICPKTKIPSSEFSGSHLRNTHTPFYPEVAEQLCHYPSLQGTETVKYALSWQRGEVRYNQLMEAHDSIKAATAQAWSWCCYTNTPAFMTYSKTQIEKQQWPRWHTCGSERKWA